MRNSLYILIISLFIFGCSKDQNTNIPLVSVNYTIYTNDPAYNAVTVPGSWMYLNGGSRGILLYRASNLGFIAYDRHCTYDSNNSCAQVAVDPSNIIVIDDCCASEFLITDGSVIRNPASLPLKKYRTSFDGSVLRIFN
jgi:nitrite reductase/ring-hydroxylating ferredoxin subunit